MLFFQKGSFPGQLQIIFNVKRVQYKKGDVSSVEYDDYKICLEQWTLKKAGGGRGLFLIFPVTRSLNFSFKMMLLHPSPDGS